MNGSMKLLEYEEEAKFKIYGGRINIQKYDLDMTKTEFLRLFKFSNADIKKFLSDQDQKLVWNGLTFLQYYGKIWILSKEFQNLGSVLASIETNDFTGKVTILFNNLTLKNLFSEILFEEKLDSAQCLFNKIGKPDPTTPNIVNLRAKLQEERERAEREKTEALEFVKKHNQDLSSILEPGPAPVPKSTDRVLPVVQGEGRIARGSDFLSSFGAGPCLILMIYDPGTGMSAMAHIDAVTTPDSISSLFKRFSNRNILEISIVSGEVNTFTMVYSLLKKIGLNNNIKRLSVDLCGERHDAVVFYGGKVYDYATLYRTPQNDPIYKNEGDLMRAIDFAAIRRAGGGPLIIHITPNDILSH